MPKTKELCEATKAAILALLEIGMSERQVAKKLKISKTAVHYNKKNKLNMALPNCYLAVAGNVFLPHEMTVHSSVPVSGIVVRPPGTLKMSGHCREMWLVRQGQFETDLLKLVWSHTEHARSPLSMKGRGRPGYSLLETTRIGLLMIGLRFSSVMNPILNWCPLQPTYWLGGSLEKLTTQTVLPLK